MIDMLGPKALRRCSWRCGTKGLDWPVPVYSTMSWPQNTLQVTMEVGPTMTGLHLLIYSTGIKMLGKAE